MTRCFMIILLALRLYGVFSADAEEVTTVKGESVTLNTGVTKQNHDKMRWYFKEIQIAYINGDASKSCLYDGEGGIFRGKLKVDYESGSLTITDVRPEHAGSYEAELIKRDSSGTSQILKTNSECDSTKITRKNSNQDDIINTFNVIVSSSGLPSSVPRSGQSADVPGSGLPSAVPGLSAGAVAGIVVAVLLV